MPFDGNAGGRSGGGGSGGRPYSVQDMTSVLFFLRACERQGLLYDLIPAQEAFEAACRIMELPAAEVRAKLDSLA